MNTISRSLTLLALAAAIALSLGACNTFRGIGKDTERVGEKIQEKADEKQYDQEADPR